jgi:glutathione S-transferase
MAEYRLHCFAQSGNAYRVAMMCELAGLDWEPVFVDFFAGATRQPEYRALNEMGEVPVLEHAGKVLTQSGVILDYLAEVTGRYGPQNSDERREILRWTLWDNQKLNGYIGPGRFMMRFISEKKRNADVIDFLMGRARNALKVLDAHLEGRDWIAAPRMTTADLSCIGYLYFDDEFGIDLAEFPNIDRWRSAIKALPGWKHPYDLMPGHPLPKTA